MPGHDRHARPPGPIGARIPGPGVSRIAPRSSARGAGQPGQRKHPTAPHGTGRAGGRGAGQPGAGHTAPPPRTEAEAPEVGPAHAVLGPDHRRSTAPAPRQVNKTYILLSVHLPRSTKYPVLLGGGEGRAGGRSSGLLRFSERAGTLAHCLGF